MWKILATLLLTTHTEHIYLIDQSFFFSQAKLFTRYLYPKREKLQHITESKSVRYSEVHEQREEETFSLRVKFFVSSSTP